MPKRKSADAPSLREQTLALLHDEPVEPRGQVSLVEPQDLVAPGEWSVSDPEAMDRLIRAIVAADGVVEAGRISVGCPKEVSIALRADMRWAERYQQIVHEDIYLAGLPGAMKKMLDGGSPYGLKVGHDIRPKKDVDDDDQEFGRELRSGGDVARLRAIDELILRLWSARETVSSEGRRAPAEIEDIVRSVSSHEQVKKPA